MTDKRVGVRIDVGVDGKKDVQDLTTGLDSLSRGATDAGQASKTGAAGARELEQAVRDTADEAEQAVKAVDALGKGAATTGAATTAAATGTDKLGKAARDTADGAAQAVKAVDALGKGAASTGAATTAAATGTDKLGKAARDTATGAAQAGKAVTGLADAADKADDKIRDTQRELQQLDKGAAGVQRTLGTLRDQLLAGFTFQQFVQAAAQMEQVQAGLQAVSGDSRLAGEQMAFVRQMAQAAGVDVAEAGKAFLGLAAATKGTAVEGEPARQVFEAVTLAMAKAGKGSAETQNALLALSQIASKGTVSMEELRGQLGEALPGALQAAASGLGITTQDLIKLVETGQLAAEDLFPALAKGLGDLYGSAPAAQTLSQEITNIKNAFVEMVANIGDSGGLTVLKTGAEGAQAAITFLGETLIQTGQAIGTLAAAVVSMDFSNLSAAFAQIESDARDRLLKAAAHNEVLRAALQASGDEATKAALAAQKAGQGHKDAGAAAEQAGTSVAKLAVEYAKARGELEQQIALAGKEVEAVKARGQAAVAQAAALGDEAAKRLAVGQAAAAEADALDKVAQLRQAEVKLLQQERAAKEAALKAAGEISAQREQELKDLDALIAEKKVEADTTLAQAAAAREKAKADNESAVAAAQVHEAAQALNITRAAAAKAALSDLQVQRDLVAQAKDLAKVLGDETQARELHIRQLEIEIQIVKARAQVAQVEAEGSIAVAQAKRAELEASGKLTPLKRAEIDASIQLARAKINEAKAMGAATEVLQAQLEGLRGATGAAGSATAGFGQLADSQRRLAQETDTATDALERQSAALQQRQYDADKFALGSDGQRFTASGQLTPPDDSGDWTFVGDVRAGRGGKSNGPGIVVVPGQGYWKRKGGGAGSAALGSGGAPAPTGTGGAQALGTGAGTEPVVNSAPAPTATTRTLRLDLGGGRGIDYQAGSAAEAARVETLLRTLANESARAA